MGHATFDGGVVNLYATIGQEQVYAIWKCT